MIDLAAFQTEIMGVIRAVWPEITPPDVQPQRLWTSVQALRKSFLDDLRGGEIALPCVVMAFGRLDQTEMGIASPIYRLPLGIFYIDAMANGATQLTMASKAAALARAIDGYLGHPPTDFATFMAPPEWAVLDSSEGSPVNAEFLGDSGIQIVSASIRWEPGLYVFDA